MASSTREKAIALWGNKIPAQDKVKLAQILFCCENPPGKSEIAGSQDAIGIVMPGINKAHYNGEFWPDKIETISDKKGIGFLENHLSLLPLKPRHNGFRVLKKSRITKSGAKKLSLAAQNAWQAILNKNLEKLGIAVTKSFEAQVAMFPLMVNQEIKKFIKEVKIKHRDNILGYKLSGAGGGGYLICITREPLPDSIGVKIMREIIRD